MKIHPFYVLQKERFNVGVEKNKETNWAYESKLTSNSYLTVLYRELP